MRRPRLLAAVVLIGLVGAGCGSSAPAKGGGAEAGASRTATDQDQAVKFAECMRAHGVPHFPDPDAKGDFDFGIDVSRAVWQRAVNACRDLQPPGSLSGKRSPKQQSDALRFAQCIRDNGVKDFPDPVNGAPLVDTTRIPSANRPGGMTILNAAMQKCRSAMRQVLGGRG